MDDEISVEAGKVLNAAEAAEFGEFCRARRETEVTFTLKKLMIDASRRETDKNTLKRACETAVKLGASGVLVSPVNLMAAKRQLPAGQYALCCLVGGTGESLMGVKKYEAKRAVKQGANELRLVLCYSQLVGGGYSYLKREIRRVRKTIRRGTLIVSLEDHSLGEENVALGVRAAAAAKANAVCVRGETPLVLRAVKEAGSRIKVEASDVENAEQLRMLVKAGISRATTGKGEAIAETLYAALREN